MRKSCEFKEVIYDVNADPTAVRRELEEINQEYFTNLLKQRGDISEARVKEISEQMESDRLEILETVKQAQAREKGQDFRSCIEDYLRSTGKDELNPEAIKREFKVLLDDPQVGISLLRSRLSQFDRDTLVINYEGIKQDFAKVFDDPQAGFEALRDRIH
ncbi:hypothetical protein [Nostoc sp. ChiQUE01b]|uniref:hypothetical protein n=1 Tax=Nostoc sp. ChiQUE01b TaxID=3075376 RepID=UPI002AD31BD2|nr:hypothetical protein [Nostoc sp. ChiQUE01b]MDZ8260229.1 hypothetical protein [Nostoc sp. ChiQUE01b]